MPDASRPLPADRRLDELAEAAAHRDAFAQFRTWWAEETGAGLRLPPAVILATAGRTGRPSVRTILLNAWDERGLVFHTNYASRKAREIAENPRGALLLLWAAQRRQVRIEGPIHRLAPEESDAYFRQRPRGQPDRRVGIASERRDPGSRGVGGARRRTGGSPSGTGRAAAALLGRVPPRARVVRVLAEPAEPLHDRLRYRRQHGGWTIERLSP